MFLIGTAAEVNPVASIDKYKFKVCDTIKELSESYQGFSEKEKRSLIFIIFINYVIYTFN